MNVRIEINPIGKILRDKGLLADGRIQMFHTQNVLRRIQRFMPKQEGEFIKLMIVQTDIRKPEIVVDAPQGKYLFYGKVMIDPKINAAGFMTPEGWRSRKGSVKVLTSRNLVIKTNKNPKAGPRWDKALSASDGPVMAAELQRYINHLGRSNK